MSKERIKNPVVEIASGCEKPEGILASSVFRGIVRNFLALEIVALEGKEDSRSLSRVEYLKNVQPADFLRIWRGEINDIGQIKPLIELSSEIFDYYRSSDCYSRLLQWVDPADLAKIPETERNDFLLKIIEKLGEKSSHLHLLINTLRRELNAKANINESIFRDLDATTKIQSVTIAGHFAKGLPTDYTDLASVPFVIAAQVHTGIDYKTSSNKRSMPFRRLDENPFQDERFKLENYIAIPLDVGGRLVFVYLHKSKGSREMGPGLLNLFPIANLKEVGERKPDAIFFFGDQDATKEQFGFHQDKKNDMLVGMVPGQAEFGYFGYLKKPILTLHNTLTIEKGELPLHCACERYVVKFSTQGEPYIDSIHVKADDMGKIRFEEDEHKETAILFRGTETGAFACLDGFSEETRRHLAERQIGYNLDAGDNSRVVVPITSDAEVRREDELDYLFYVNNYDLVPEGESTLKTLSVDDMVEILRNGERVAAGSTGTARGEKEVSFWANPFPALKDKEGNVLDSELSEKFSEIEARFSGIARNLAAKGKLTVGVAYSQMMAGAGNEFENLRKFYEPEFARDKQVDELSVTEIKTWRKEVEKHFEMSGPKRHSEDLQKMILGIAKNKREHLRDPETGELPSEVSVTGARVGDSRTGKSEAIAAMSTRLGLPFTI